MAVERKKPKETAQEAGNDKTADERKTSSDKKTQPERKSAARSKGRGKAAGARARTQAKRPAAKEETAPQAKPTAPRRRTRGREEDAKRVPARPVVRAQAKYVRSSARKARLVIEHIRGKSVEEAQAVLRHTPRGIARDLEKLLKSAVANAENNHELVGDDLVIKDVYADEGPTIKRFRPRALGRATRIRKRTSHLTLTVTPKE
jgi:ribosomal protein L22